MDNLGYLYVLANSAMPGLVKVGKTTRTPSERAGELSGVTGMPTPFIVVYEQLFQDCSSAEAFVHTYLAHRGHRISDNREFFSAPVNIVVRALGLAPGAIDGDVPQLDSEPDELIERHEPDDLDSLNLPEPEPPFPWMDIFLEAVAHYNGTGDHLEDHVEAMRLFRQAATLGAIPAYGYIGRMYANAEGVGQDVTMALEFYKEGARKGNVYCDWAMGVLFKRQGHTENAEKCIARFTRNMSNLPPKSLGLLPTDLKLVFDSCVLRLLTKTVFFENEEMKESHDSMLSGFKEGEPNLYKFITENSPGITRSAEAYLKEFKATNDIEWVNKIEKALRLLSTLH